MEVSPNATETTMSTAVSTSIPATGGSTTTTPEPTATEPGPTRTATAGPPTESGSTTASVEPPVSTVATSTAQSSQSVSTEAGTTTPPGGSSGWTTTAAGGTAGVTSSMTQAVTSEPTGRPTTTVVTTNGGPGPNEVSLPVYVVAGVLSGLVVLVLIFAIGVWCFRRRGRSRGGSRSRNPFGPDEMDKLDPKDRMSVHRPVSATVNANDDLAFVTFTAGPGTNASAEYHVDGIENPTYALSNVSDDEEEEEELTAGEGGQQHQNSAATATIPSQARLGSAVPREGAAPTEGAVAAPADGSQDRLKDRIRPQSGVSYTSNDIDGALETLDIGSV